LAREWLDDHSFADLVGEVFSSAGTTKHAVGERLGAHVLLDDDPRHLRFSDPGVRRFLFKERAFAELEVPRGATVVAGWPDFVRRVSVASSPS
jgi:hypothetical protein